MAFMCHQWEDHNALCEAYCIRRAFPAAFQPTAAPGARIANPALVAQKVDYPGQFDFKPDNPLGPPTSSGPATDDLVNRIHAAATDREWQDAAEALGSEGGKKAAGNMTPEQRTERARKAGKARWSKRKAGREG